MRVLVIENYPKTTLGLVGEALAEAGAESRLLRTHLGETLPATPDGFDALIMLGGAQDALDDDEPSLSEGRGGARPRLRRCGQGGSWNLPRRADPGARHGAENILGRPIEFGWHEVRTTEAGRADPVLAAIGDAAPIFHWHLDTFTLAARRRASCDERA